MKQIIDAIEGDKSVLLNLYTLNNTSEDRIRKVLALFLKKHDCVPLLDPIYICIKELLINAIRANYMSIFFENFNKPVTAGILDNRKAMQLFQLEMTKDEARNLARIARTNNITTELQLEITGNLLTVTVSNPVSIPAIELNVVIGRISNAARKDDLSRFFDEYFEEFEDEEGVGLVIVSMILKNLTSETDLLQIESQGGKTTARISIPLAPKVVARYRKIIADAE